MYDNIKKNLKLAYKILYIVLLTYFFFISVIGYVNAVNEFNNYFINNSIPQVKVNEILNMFKMQLIIVVASMSVLVLIGTTIIKEKFSFKNWFKSSLILILTLIVSIGYFMYYIYQPPGFFRDSLLIFLPFTLSIIGITMFLITKLDNKTLNIIHQKIKERKITD